MLRRRLISQLLTVNLPKTKSLLLLMQTMSPRLMSRLRLNLQMRLMMKKTLRRTKLRKRKKRRNPSTTLLASVPSAVWATTLLATSRRRAVRLLQALKCLRTLSWTRDSAQTDPLAVLSRAASLAQAHSEDSAADLAVLAAVVHSGELKVCKKNLLCALRLEKRQI